MSEFTPSDYWKGVILFGLNNATYKMGLGKVLLKHAKAGANRISWEDLSKDFLSEYVNRLTDDPMPQQTNPARRAVMERIAADLMGNRISESQAIERVATDAFNDVVPRFQTIGTDKSIVKNLFYEPDLGKQLVLTDTFLSLGDEGFAELDQEVDARWNLLEGAFSINQSQQNYQLANDVREVYLADGYERKSLTDNIPFLQGYQGNTCFYCGQRMEGQIHVDHVLPRQVINHDEVWNLVLSHSDCNLLKGDYLVGQHFIEKLIQRNENIIGSNHPWKHRISSQLGNTSKRRRDTLAAHYDNMRSVLGRYYWGGSELYNPETDEFYRRFITVINNS
ncbi:MAG: HNH endonuclease domain-containing protein [Halioglobus sp.]|nr:HNH endonuclease domain-containing protein [Halioglobus sp.]